MIKFVDEFEKKVFIIKTLFGTPSSRNYSVTNFCKFFNFFLPVSQAYKSQIAIFFSFNFIYQTLSDELIYKFSYVLVNSLCY